MFMAETYMLQLVKQGLDSIRSNTAQLDNILDALSSDELAAAKQFFGDATKVINIAPGFPMQEAQLPFIGVTIAADNQITEQTPIGMAYGRVDNGDGTWTDYRGARYLGNLKASIYTQNADIIVWLSAVVAWSLLSQYDTLIDYGFGNIQTGMGDYEPSPQWLPFYSFVRGVYLTAEYDKTYPSSPSIITQITSTGNYSVLE